VSDNLDAKGGLHLAQYSIFHTDTNSGLDMSNLIERINQNLINDPVAQAHWAEKKWVWVADKKEGYLQANVTQENGENFEVTFDDGSVCC
jgi:Myosin N-terminal SH3-like domain